MFQLDFQVNGKVDQQMVFFHKICEIQEVPKSGKVWESQSACLLPLVSLVRGRKCWPGAEDPVRARRELCFCSWLLWVCLWVVLTEHIC